MTAGLPLEASQSKWHSVILKLYTVKIRVSRPRLVLLVNIVVAIQAPNRILDSIHTSQEHRPKSNFDEDSAIISQGSTVANGPPGFWPPTPVASMESSSYIRECSYTAIPSCVEFSVRECARRSLASAKDRDIGPVRLFDILGCSSIILPSFPTRVCGLNYTACG